MSKIIKKKFKQSNIIKRQAGAGLKSLLYRFKKLKLARYGKTQKISSEARIRKKKLAKSLK